MATSITGGNEIIVVDSKPLKAMARDLRELDKASYDEFRGAMKASGTLVKEEAARRAGEFSTRIPPSLKVRVTGLGTTVKVVGTSPNAAPIENGGRGMVRHPTFVKEADLPGPAGSWTSKNSHPAYLAPALDAKSDEIEVLVDAAIERALAKMGFK
jgi:hypothetical protein